MLWVPKILGGNYCLVYSPIMDSLGLRRVPAEIHGQRLVTCEGVILFWLCRKKIKFLEILRCFLAQTCSGFCVSILLSHVDSCRRETICCMWQLIENRVCIDCINPKWSITESQKDIPWLSRRSSLHQVFVRILWKSNEWGCQFWIQNYRLYHACCSDSAGIRFIFCFIKPWHQPSRTVGLTGGKMCNGLVMWDQVLWHLVFLQAQWQERQEVGLSSTYPYFE